MVNRGGFHPGKLLGRKTVVQTAEGNWNRRFGLWPRDDFYVVKCHKPAFLVSHRNRGQDSKGPHF